MPTPAHLRSTIAALATPPEELRAVAAYHKALSDPTRLRLMQRLAEGPATVTELTSHVDLSQPLVSLPSPPAQGRRRRRDAPRRPRSHLHPQPRRPGPFPRAGARAAGTRELVRPRSPAIRRLARRGVPSRLPRTYRGARRGDLHPHPPDAEHADADRLRHRDRRRYLAAIQLWIPAGLVVGFGAAFDLFDGALARATGKSSKLGAFMDSVFDRAGEAVVYVGLVAGRSTLNSPKAPLLAAAAMAAAFMVSYTRAKSESLGFSSGTGIANVGWRLAKSGQSSS